MKNFFKPLLGFSLLFFTACHFTSSSTNMSSDIDEARAVADSFYSALLRKEYQQAESFLSPKLLEESPEASAFLRDNGFNTGKLQSAEYKDGESKSETKFSETNSVYRLLYETQYDSTKAEEIVTLEKKNEEPIKIVGYRINIPEDFLRQQIQKNKKDTIK